VNDHATSSLFFSALYDGDGVRVKKTDTRGALGLQVNDFSYGPQGLLWSSNPNTVHTPGFGHRSNGINTFYHHDWLGSTRYTSDATGNTFPQALRFDAFGNRSATGGTAPYHSTDLQWAGAFGYQTEWSNGASDPGVGLQYLEQRYYDPAVGRFISPDPIGFAGGLNLYGYCDSDPVNIVDPDGLGLKIGNWLEFDLEGVGRGLNTGVHAVGSVLTFGLYNGGEYRNQPGFAGAQFLGGIGRDALIDAATVVVSEAVSPALGRLGGRARQFCRLQNRAGVLRLPGGGGGRAVFDWNRAGHIFRGAFGHVNPATAASRGRLARLFEAVASDPANLRPTADAIRSGLLPRPAAQAGVQAYTQVFRSGEQVWVQVRNGIIQNAGINPVGSLR
jgi:RHS repeat-associated protein